MVIRMKRTRYAVCVVILAVVIVVMSGCVNATCGITIKNNGEHDVDLKILYNSDFDSEAVEPLVKTIRDSFSEIGYTVKDAAELGMTGFELTKTGIPLIGDGFADKLPYNIDLLDDIMYNKEFEEEARCNTYTLKTDIDLQQFSTIPQSVKQKYTQAEYTKFLSDMNFKLVLTLEGGEILSTNSKKVSADKKTAEWVLIPGAINHVEMDAVLGVNRGWKVSMAIVAVLAVLMAMFAITLTKMYKTKQADD